VDAEAENQSVLELTVKIRAMDDEPREEPRLIEVQQVTNGHPNGGGNGSTDGR